MTRDEILAMEAGRELDALVGEYLFGWEWDTDEEDGRRFLRGPVKGDWLLTYWPDSRYEQRPDPYSLPAYSTDIAAAWRVVAAWRAKGGVVSIISDWHFNERALWRVALRSSAGDDYVVAEQALPEAVCKAALLGVFEARLGT